LLGVLKFILILLSPLFLFLILEIISFAFFHIKHYKKGLRIKKSLSNYKKHSVFKRLLIQFPERLSLDMYNRDPDDFNEYGLHMFCGEQGSGKTTAIVHLLQTMQHKYAKLKVRTNMNYINEDGQINHWQELVENTNGTYGQIEVLDEIQTWFSSNQSKDFPPDMLTEISQQRKQRKMLIGSAQVFSRIAKPIREQTTFVYLPLTIAGCLTIVRVSKPQYWDDEKQVFKRYIRNYFFVHTEELRNAFETYKKIEKYKIEGFKQENNIKLLKDA